MWTLSAEEEEEDWMWTLSAEEEENRIFKASAYS
jgi:hypothetical protein